MNSSRRCGFVSQLTGGGTFGQANSGLQAVLRHFLLSDFLAACCAAQGRSLLVSVYQPGIAVSGSRPLPG